MILRSNRPISAGAARGPMACVSFDVAVLLYTPTMPHDESSQTMQPAMMKPSEGSTMQPARRGRQQSLVGREVAGARNVKQTEQQNTFY